MHLFISESLLAIAAAGLSWSLIGLYTRAMRLRRRLEAPNERSMHKVPVPVGAGIAMVATVLVLWPWWRRSASGPISLLLAGIAGLGALSWIDDRRGLSASRSAWSRRPSPSPCAWPGCRRRPACCRSCRRCSSVCSWASPGCGSSISSISWTASTGSRAARRVAVALGYLLLLAYADLDGPLWRLALVIAASTVGYLFWNWHPAKVLMGDAGSIPLGFLLAGLMLDLALRGYWAAGLILPLYFVADATITLLTRARRGEKPWQAHREHFYQRAVLGGATPAGVVWRVSAANACACGAGACLRLHSQCWRSSPPWVSWRACWRTWSSLAGRRAS